MQWNITPAIEKKNEILPFATMWMDLESIMLSELSQKEQDKHCRFSLVCGIWKIKQMNVYNKIETDSRNYREQTSCYGGRVGGAEERS